MRRADPHGARVESARRLPRRFDPVRLGRMETAAWVTYYQRRPLACLRAFVGLVGAGFGLSGSRALRGAWYLWLANRAWRPYPDNDPEAAREYMARFYELVRDDGDLDFEPVKAAVLELEWWRRHRLRQQNELLDVERVVESLAALYSYVYGIDADLAQPAARRRVAAMELCDEWALGGAAPDDPRVGEQRREVIASYSMLSEAVRVRR